jgi:hypothetical protein
LDEPWWTIGILGGLMDVIRTFLLRPVGQVVEQRRENIEKARKTAHDQTNRCALHHINQSITAGTVEFNIIENSKARSSSCSGKVNTNRKIDGRSIEIRSSEIMRSGIEYAMKLWPATYAITKLAGRKLGTSFDGHMDFFFMGGPILTTCSKF